MAKETSRNPWISLLVIFLAVMFIGLFMVSCISMIAGPSSIPIGGNVAVVELNGEISPDAGGIFASGMSSDDVVELIKQANENPSIKAILIKINSPGGTPVASEEIAFAVKTSNKTTVALIRDQGTSGAYWVASAADVIVASPVSITGSIGVIGSSLEFSKFMEKYGIGYERLIAGEYKDIGIPFRNLTPEERVIMQQRLDLIHAHFIKSVAENRNLSLNKTTELANGLFYTGSQAYDLGLIDYLGGEQEAINAIKMETGLTDVVLVPFKKQRGLFDVFGDVAAYNSFAMGRGIGRELLASNDQMVRT